MSNNSNSGALTGLFAYCFGAIGTMTYLTHRDGLEAQSYYKNNEKSKIVGLTTVIHSENEAYSFGSKLKLKDNAIDSIFFPFYWVHQSYVQIVNTIAP